MNVKNKIMETNTIKIVANVFFVLGVISVKISFLKNNYIIKNSYYNKIYINNEVSLNTENKNFIFNNYGILLF